MNIYPTSILKCRNWPKSLRNLILEIKPEVDEVIKWKNLIYEEKRMICAIIIHKSHINLEFFQGEELKEMGYSLEGSGKNMRHVKISKFTRMDDTLRDMIIKAFELK